MTESDRKRTFLLPSRLREGSGVGSNVAMAHPAAANEHVRKPRCPSRLREGKSAHCCNVPSPPQSGPFSFANKKGGTRPPWIVFGVTCLQTLFAAMTHFQGHALLARGEMRHLILPRFA